MEVSDLQKLLDRLASMPKESEIVEFKENFHSKEEIGERLSALSNSACLQKQAFAYLVFGVEDQKHIKYTERLSAPKCRWSAMRNWKYGC